MDALNPQDRRDESGEYHIESTAQGVVKMMSNLVACYINEIKT
jgi:hypothetical protein